MQKTVHVSVPWVVIKFGGTSVASANCWRKITYVVQRHLKQGHRPLVVCSAPQGVSNLLEELLRVSKSIESNEILAKIQNKYRVLAQELQLDCADYLQEQFHLLQKLIEGVHLINESTPRVHARVMAFGELMLTYLGSCYLQAQGLKTHWQDVRNWLEVLPHADFRHPDAYLSARCSSDRDIDLQSTLAALDVDVVITQGFIGRNQQGETVLLGRGGSDSSAAYLSAKIQAKSCEIWTDVPGIYTANPKQIPQARLITQLDYDEAQEIASMGAAVLHPKCIGPVKAQQIPLYVKYTQQPDRLGTTVCRETRQQDSQIKSIITKHQLVLISIETMKMWQQVGFLAEVFECFKRHGVSIDLVSTSESSVTVSLDQSRKESRVLDTLLNDLNQFARAKVISPCASVSLVGCNIRAILHQLGSVFSVFEEQKVYLLSQAANDLNLTFVVDEEQALRIAAKLHHLLIERNHTSRGFDLSWQEEFGETIEAQTPWWQTNRTELLALAVNVHPSYVYSQQRLQEVVVGLKSCDSIDRIFYSIKANSHPAILKQFYREGLGFECVSIDEVKHILQWFPDISKDRVLFTPNFASRDEYQQVLDLGFIVTVDSLYPLLHWPSIFKDQEIFIRVDLGKGSGHHKYVVTGGDQSKFGIPLVDLAKVSEITQQQHIKVVGLHSHAGSGILDSYHWSRVLRSLADLTKQFTQVKFLNIGGGLGIVERQGQRPINLDELNQSLKEIKAQYPQLTLCMEPGRYLVAESGVLLARVTQVKQKGDLQFVGIETGMNSLIRPALYGSYHEIVNLTRLSEPQSQRVNIVGPICESADILGYSRWMPSCQEGDVILIANTGAYGYSMSSHYNLRRPAAEHYFSCAPCLDAVE